MQYMEAGSAAAVSDAMQPLLITHRLRGELENFNEISKLKLELVLNSFFGGRAR